MDRRVIWTKELKKKELQYLITGIIGTGHLVSAGN